MEAVDDEETQDALARKMAIEFAVIADDTRAVEVRVLSVSESVFYARYVVLATAFNSCLLYTSPSPRDQRGSRMPSSA